MKTTSIEAYEKVKASGKLKGIQFDVFRYVCGACHEGQAPTAREVASRMSGHQIDSIRPRFAELERRGVLRPSGERVCNITQQRAITWEPTGELPGTPKPRGEGKTGALRAKLEACRQEAASLRRECADKALEISALKAKLSKWGRPPNSIRAERAMRNRAQEFPCMVATNVRQEGHETTNGQHNGEADGACPGARETGHGVPCADSARPENPSQGGNDGHGSGCACSSRTTPNPG